MGYEAFWWVFVGTVIGYTYAHHVVAAECEKLGRFYVGDKVFHCKKIERKDGKPFDKTE